MVVPVVVVIFPDFRRLLGRVLFAAEDLFFLGTTSRPGAYFKHLKGSENFIIVTNNHGAIGACFQ
jgi:hypothetical protein